MLCGCAFAMSCVEAGPGLGSGNWRSVFVGFIIVVGYTGTSLELRALLFVGYTKLLWS